MKYSQGKVFKQAAMLAYFVQLGNLNNLELPATVRACLEQSFTGKLYTTATSNTMGCGIPSMCFADYGKRLSLPGSSLTTDQHVVQAYLKFIGNRALGASGLALTKGKVYSVVYKASSAITFFHEAAGCNECDLLLNCDKIRA